MEPYNAKLFLKQNEADVWFKFGDVQIPVHKYIITEKSPWINTMFNGSPPEGDEVNMNDSNITVDAFVELLRFIYLQTTNLTFENIEEVIDLAKQSLVDGLFAECEDFLMKNVAPDTIDFAYELALHYDAKRLKKECERQISRLAYDVVKKSSFLKFHYEFLLNILRCDILDCNEVAIFDACIAWATSECVKSGYDPKNMENLRKKLKDCLYHVRFSSMTREELANSINLYRGLFSSIELEELMCMGSCLTEFNPKLFNWTPRRWFDENILDDDEKMIIQRAKKLNCNRLWPTSELRSLLRYLMRIEYKFKRVEETVFITDRFILLSGFNCECFKEIQLPATIKIYRLGNDFSLVEEHSERVQLNFTRQQSYLSPTSYKTNVTLNRSVFIEQGVTQVIEIHFDTEPIYDYQKLYSVVPFQDSVEVEPQSSLRTHFNFLTKGIISAIKFKVLDIRSVRPLKFK